MRKGQRFTPARLQRWSLAGRGTGTGATYQPWHQVTRDDPGSRGRSHLVSWRFGRLHHLLSDQELVAFGFASMLPGLVDVREQFALAADEHPPEVAAYRTGWHAPAPGTLKIASDLGFAHPVVRRGGDKRPWVMSTDLVLTMTGNAAGPSLLAISVKHQAELTNVRKRELLRIEHEYWQRQGVPWLLLTPALHAPAVGTAIRVGMPWALGQEAVSASLIDGCSALSVRIHGLPMRHVQALVAEALDLDTWSAHAVIWQAIWCGRLPVDLRSPMRPDQPLEILPLDAFWQQNPIASRRSAWAH